MDGYPKDIELVWVMDIGYLLLKLLLGVGAFAIGEIAVAAFTLKC